MTYYVAIRQQILEIYIEKTDLNDDRTYAMKGGNACNNSCIKALLYLKIRLKQMQHAIYVNYSFPIAPGSYKMFDPIPDSHVYQNI